MYLCPLSICKDIQYIRAFHPVSACQILSGSPDGFTRVIDRQGGSLAAQAGPFACHCPGPSCELDGLGHGSWSLHGCADAGYVSGPGGMWGGNISGRKGEHVPHFGQNGYSKDPIYKVTDLDSHAVNLPSGAQRLPFLAALPWSAPHFGLAWDHTFDSQMKTTKAGMGL